MPSQLSLFRSKVRPRKLPRLPDLSRWQVLALDTETTGLNVTTGAKAIGLSIAGLRLAPVYFPWGHAAGENLDPWVVQEWASRELRGKTFAMLNAKFDVHALRAAGIDLEALGCQVTDVGHAAALLDGDRRSYSLESLSQRYLGKGKTVLAEDGRKIHEKEWTEVSTYAARDALLTLELHSVLQPKIQAESLGEVLRLEDALVYVTCEMERNAAPLDVEKLERWCREAQARYTSLVLELYRLVGFRVIPTSPTELARLFSHLGIPWGKTPTGQPSFTDEFLEQHEGVPAVALALEGRRLASLSSKYLDKYAREVGRDGLLRYQLNQLRSDQYGTITGRYSSSNMNIQQVFKAERQAETMPDYIIRELFIPPPGRRWFTADASQIEFRIFAHYARSTRLINAYRNDPSTDFHTTVAELTGLPRLRAKNLNFGRLYGMGREKMARMLKLPMSESDPLFDRYDELFPEARRLLRHAADLAEQRGYVRTFLGRRRRYVPGEKSHSALNAAIQGTAADIMKLKLLDLYRRREELGVTLRFTVHDEVDGDVAPDANLEALRAALDEPTLPLDVPIIWDLKVGNNWKETS